MNFKDFKKEKIIVKKSKDYGTLKELDKVSKDIFEDFDLDIEDIEQEPETESEVEVVQLFDGYLGEKNFDPNPLEYGPNATYRKNGTVFKKSIDNLWETYLQDGKQGPKGSAGGSGTGVQEVQKISNDVVDQRIPEIYSYVTSSVTSAISQINVSALDFSPILLYGNPIKTNITVTPESLQRIKLPLGSMLKFVWNGYGGFVLAQGDINVSANLKDYIEYPGYDEVTGLQTFYIKRSPGSTYFSIYGIGTGTLRLEPGTYNAEIENDLIEYDTVIYVQNSSLSGNGSIETPFNINSGINYIKSLSATNKNILVNMVGGDYEVSSTINLSNINNKVYFRPYDTSSVNLIGGKVLGYNNFSLITSSDYVWNRVDTSARSHIYKTNINQVLGITTATSQVTKNLLYGTLKERGFGGTLNSYLEVSVDDVMYDLASFPNKTDNVPDQSISGSTFIIYGSATPNVSGTYTLNGTLASAGSYIRTGLVDGKQYYLHRMYFNNLEAGDSGFHWYITTNPTTWTPEDPYWMSYGTPEPTIFYPANSSADGWLFPRDLNSPKQGHIRAQSPLGTGNFSIVNNKLSAWTNTSAIWCDVWTAAWEERHYRVSAINSNRFTISGAGASRNFEQGMWLKFYNVIEELNSLGEYYLDQLNGLLYIYSNDLNSNSKIIVSTLETDLINIQNSSNIIFDNINVKSSRKTQINILNSRDIQLKNMKIYNSGGSSIYVDNSQNVNISSCDISGSGHGSIFMYSGDRLGLIKCNNTISNNDISRSGRFQYSGVQSIYMSGCGITVKNNYFHNSPDRAIGYDGNEHLILNNEIDSMCEFCSDAATIYMGTWSCRGNIIKNNFIHDISKNLNGYHNHGIYCDNAGHGVYSEGNIFYKIAGAAHKISGRDNVMVNNITVESGIGNYIYDTLNFSALGYPNESYLTDIQKYNYQQEPWSLRYPACSAIPNSWATISANPTIWCVPRESVFSRNINWKNGLSWLYGLDRVKAYFINGASVETLNIKDQDPLFVDEANGNLNLLPNSPAFIMPGFKPIPFDQIGLQR